MTTKPNPFKDSIYKTLQGVEYKSCPACSRAAMRPVFHRLDSYSYRTIGKRTLPQSWCSKCRHDKAAA